MLRRALQVNCRGMRATCNKSIRAWDGSKYEHQKNTVLRVLPAKGSQLKRVGLLVPLARRGPDPQRAGPFTKS